MSSVFEHPWLSGLFNDAAIAQILSAEAELERMRAVEIAWIAAQADVGLIDEPLAAQAIAHIENAAVPMDDLKDGTAQDGLPVPRLVNCLKYGASDKIKSVIHTGLTSQDVMDTSLTLALQSILPIYHARLGQLCKQLDDLSTQHGENTLMGYTRLQAALRITAGHRIAAWQAPLSGYASDITAQCDRLRVLQFGGPVGVRPSGGSTQTGAAFAKRLNLRDPGRAWHNTRHDLAALTATLTQITGSLGKLGQDIALMAQRGDADIRLAGGGSSSAMPHKQNPIRAELLMTLAHHAASLQHSMATAMIHEQERSGTMWALEWMTLPDLLQTCGRSLSGACELTGQIIHIGTLPGQS